MKIEAEDFKAWLDNPVTENVIKYLRKKIGECREGWVSASLVNGQCDPLLLADLRARIEILNDLANLKLEDIEDEE